MKSLLALSGLVLALLPACSDNDRPAPVGPGPAPDPDPPPAPIRLGDPLPGLTEAELAAFERGRALFVKRFRPSEGLGPLYNATSCESCHSDPVVGGTADLYRNFYIAVVGVSLNFTINLPGLPSPAVPAFGATNDAPFSLERARRELPATFGGLPVRVAQRNSIPIFGVGLFEAIRNETILANADPDDDDQDGISGRVNNDGAGLGRFGMKAQSNNIEFFTRAPLFNQMGITSDPFLGAAGTVRCGLEHGSAFQGSATPNAPTRDNDGVPDPEIARQDLGDLIAFTRFLAPPQPKPFDEKARRGEARFEQIGCAKCHIPELPSSRGPVRAFTDLLLHNMGEELADGIPFGTPQASAIDPDHTAFEFRTSPLWGVSHFPPYLHDGRARTIDEAIRMHGGEALAARQAYEGLAAEQREDLLTFLRHL